jgi:ribose/xylose/arabinose/galactoside ABC-type transport system permease subunit
MAISLFTADREPGNNQNASPGKNGGAVWRQGLFKQGATLLVLVVLCIIFSSLSPHFSSMVNILNIFEQGAVLGIIACGMAFMIICGGFDLSVGSTAALTGMVVGLILKDNPDSFFLAIAAGLAIGVTIGLINGLLITKVGINPFITTLGMMVIVRGIVFVLTTGKTVYGFPQEYNFIGMGKLGPVPVPMLIWAAVVAACHFVLKYTRLGQYVFAVGGNETVAHLSGINVDRVKIMSAVITAVLASLAGIVLVFRVMAALPQAAASYELYAIAAAVVGGCALGGGIGGVLGTVIGTLILGVIINGLHIVGVSSYWESTVTGLIIILAVGMDVISRRVAKAG